jgi:hypothetical protein
MCGVPPLTVFFYSSVLLIGIIGPEICVYRIWRVTLQQQLMWTTENSRTMYVDVAKTFISASGISVALLAAASNRVPNLSSETYVKQIIATSAKVSAFCLISCVVSSLFVILALVRGFEMARARRVKVLGKEGHGAGELTHTELLKIIVPAGVALPCFVTGFLFLGRVTFRLF